MHEQSRDVEVVVDLHAELGHAIDERALHLAAGVVAGEARAPIGVRAEVALGEPTVRLARELGAVADEIVDRGGRLAREQLDDARVGEVVRLGDRVGGVLLPAVLGVHRAERRVDATGREHRVGVIAPALADAEDLMTGLGELDRGPEAGGPRADHQDAGGGTAIVGSVGTHTRDTGAEQFTMSDLAAAGRPLGHA